MKMLILSRATATSTDAKMPRTKVSQGEAIW